MICYISTEYRKSDWSRSIPVGQSDLLKIDTDLARSYNPSMSRQTLSVMTVALGWILFVSSCIYSRPKISNAGDIPSSVQSQLASGEQIYTQTCATRACHGTQGEGIKSGNSFSAWPLVGKEFQSRHPNAQVVFDVIRSGGERNLLALTDQQVYDAIAYELRQNQITLASPLTAENAFTIYGGAMSGNVQGGLFPPSDNAALIDTRSVRDLPIVAQNDMLQLQVDQIAEASAIGSSKGIFLLLVMMFSDLDDQPIALSPAYLSLSTPSGKRLKTQSINIHSAIEKFREQTIKPRYGTVGLVVFTLTAPDQFDQLIYNDGVGKPLTMALKP